MNEILMTNIFFIITAVATIVLTIVLVILLIYVIKLVKRLRYLTEIVTDEAEQVIHDIDETRDNVKETIATVKGVAIAKILAFVRKKIFGDK